MDLDLQTVRRFRLAAHHLDRPLPPGSLGEAAGACGFQNSPPGSWETAAFNRVEGCTLEGLEAALCREKSLLQAWSWRGAPVVFPAGEEGVFLAPLAAREGEEPWIYTQGIGLALDRLGMTFRQLLPLLEEAIRALDGETVRSKEALDRFLADRMEPLLPPSVLPRWREPSPYGRPHRQTVGGGAVSFLLRPCSFKGLVVFGRREGSTPTFTSFRRWTGRDPRPLPQGERALAERFLHCYGPAVPASFQAWLGSSPRQARRLWEAAREGMAPVTVGGKTAWVLDRDREALRALSRDPPQGLRLLGPHDPYLDLRDRGLLLPDLQKQRLVWRTAANPGVVLREGRVAGIWKAKTQGDRLSLALTLWEPFPPNQRRRLEELGEACAAFRRLHLAAFSLEEG